MTRRPASAATAAAVLALAGCGGRDAPAGDAERDPPPATDLRPAPAEQAPPPSRPADALAAVVGDAAVRPRRRMALRAAPGGRAVARVGRMTPFGSPRWMAVARRRGAWVGVIAPERPNGRLGWLRVRDVAVRHVSVRLAVDLSERRLVVRRDGRPVLRMTVGIGAPDTSTPTGRFAVTDGLRTEAGSPYGCCILALSGHQPNVPQGWAGGDRIAVHGTTAPATIGAAASTGCLRAADADLRRLLRVTQLGARIDIRA